MTPRTALCLSMGCTWYLVGLAVMVYRTGSHWFWWVELMCFASLGVYVSWRNARALAESRWPGRRV